jgi:hypothetical protein
MTGVVAESSSYVGVAGEAEQADHKVAWPLLGAAAGAGLVQVLT